MHAGASLVAQWLRLLLPLQGAWVWFLIGELRSWKPRGPCIIPTVQGCCKDSETMHLRCPEHTRCLKWLFPSAQRLFFVTDDDLFSPTQLWLSVCACPIVWRSPENWGPPWPLNGRSWQLNVAYFTEPRGILSFPIPSNLRWPSIYPTIAPLSRILPFPPTQTNRPSSRVWGVIENLSIS